MLCMSVCVCLSTLCHTRRSVGIVQQNQIKKAKKVQDDIRAEHERLVANHLARLKRGAAAEVQADNNAKQVCTYVAMPGGLAICASVRTHDAGFADAGQTGNMSTTLSASCQCLLLLLLLHAATTAGVHVASRRAHSR